MLKVILTKGLPASVKSTFAKDVLAQHPNQYKRVNKDDLRAMLDNGAFDGKKTEKTLYSPCAIKSFLPRLRRASM